MTSPASNGHVQIKSTLTRVITSVKGYCFEQNSHDEILNLIIYRALSTISVINFNHKCNKLIQPQIYTCDKVPG